MVSLDRRIGGPEEEESGLLIDLFDSPGRKPGRGKPVVGTAGGRSPRVAELPEQTRQVVMLVYFQGLKYREAAEVLSIPVGTVKSRIHAAIEKLTESLGSVDE